MTRINAGIHPSELSREHLIAEHREIIRIPNNIKKGKYNLKGIPEKFKLNTGHVKFFYNKLKYVHERYNRLYLEGISRGYNLTNFNECFIDLPIDLYNDWTETVDARVEVLDRLTEKYIKKMGNLEQFKSRYIKIKMSFSDSAYKWGHGWLREDKDLFDPKVKIAAANAGFKTYTDRWGTIMGVNVDHGESVYFHPMDFTFIVKKTRKDIYLEAFKNSVYTVDKVLEIEVNANDMDANRRYLTKFNKLKRNKV